MALFGRYEYVKELGRGATGRVCAARDLADNLAPRALKVVPAEEAGRLLWEFSRLSRVIHPRVARVRELLRVHEALPDPWSLAPGTLVLVEDLAPGAPLSERAANVDGSDTAARGWLDIATSVAEALSAVHEAGLVHGDVKPENVLWDDARGATLVDLGFAQAPSSAATPRGTPLYMAPELFRGLCTPAADVYALGALLFDALASAPAASSSSEGTTAWVARDVQTLPQACPEPLRRVIAELLQTDPLRRPQTGRAALALVLGAARALGHRVDAALVRYAALADAWTPAQRAQRARSLPFVGREAEIARLAEAIQERGLIWIEGPRGAGCSRLVREAVSRAQEQVAARGERALTLVSSLAALETLVDVDVALWLERPSADLVDQAARAVDALAFRGQRLSVVLEGAAPQASRAQAAHRETRLSLGPLSDGDFDALLDALLAPQKRSPAVRAAAHAASAGLAGRLCELVASACAEGRDLADPHSYRAPSAAPVLGCSAQAYELAVWLAWLEGAAVDPGVLEARLGHELGPALDALRARGVIEPEADSYRLTFSAACELRRHTRAQAAELVRQLGEAGASAATPYLCWARGEHEAAAALFLREAQRRVQKGRPEEACELLEEALAFVDAAGLRLLLAELQRARANYAAAASTVAGLEGPEAQLARAELARLAGNVDAAQRALEAPLAGVWAARAEALRARVAYDLRDFASARRASEAALGSSDALAQLRALEVRLLLALAEGQADSELASRLVLGAQAVAIPRMLARALSLRAQVHLARGARELAIADLREAVSRAQQAGEVHEASTYALNLSLCQLEAGELGAALEGLRDAAYLLARIDRPADLLRVLYNLGHAAILVGDDARAEFVLSEAERRLVQVRDPAAQAMIAVGRAELSLRRGLVSAALAHLEGALTQVPPALSGVRTTVAIRTALARLVAGQVQGAQALYAELSAEAEGGAAPPLELRALQIRLALAQGALSSAHEMAERLVRALPEGAPFGERVEALLAAIDAARACARESDVLAWSALCRALLERSLLGLPPSLRASMRAVPAYARVLATEVQGHAPEHAAVGTRFRALVRAGRRLFAEGKPQRIVQHVADIALELVHAERALVIAEREGEGFAVVGRSQLSRLSPVSFSRSVVERALLDASPLVAVEALSDPRFDAAQSVHTLSVRSVVAVPLEGLPTRAVLYLDDRLRAAAFGPEDQALLADLAELARQALQVAAALREEQRRTRHALRREDRLLRELEQVKATQTHAQSAPPSERLPAPFVGESGAMQRLTERARKIAKADVPVLICGESGTGKELLARFIHAESPRRAAPFVAENCAALPDALLESALFGHVRGAFTGAERARRGLFEIADGGTLFLDEVAEMSPAMQSKLLRVLQEREVRALGGEQVRKVDVRVLGATHRDLAAMVREGRFREDLYYRLAVVTLELPALRERREDIPALVKHFVAQHGAGKSSVRVTPQAMRLLEDRPYPGNVRQLENVVRRALALCDDEIRLEHVEDPDLSTTPEEAASELDLHAQTEQLTRRLVELAMARTGGNVSQAAELLGISRFGLQKMLRRLSGARVERQRK